MSITFKSASNAVSIVAGLLCLGGVLSWLKADTAVKPYALNIALSAGVLAAGNHLSSRWYEQLANDQYRENAERMKKKYADISGKHDQQVASLAEIKALAEQRSQQLAIVTEELQAKDRALKLLQDNLGRIKAEFEAKGRELDAKLQEDDSRYQAFLSEFKGQLVSDLSERIYSVYNQLSDSVEARLRREDYQAIHENLQQFFNSLEPSYKFHCSLLDEITNLDGTASEILTSAVDIYHQVNDEIAALRVRFRNLLNIDERRALEDAYTTLADYSKKFTPINKAKDVLREYEDFQKKQLENLYNSISENDNSLEEMRAQVNDLLNQLDAQHLKIAQLNQQIIDLKKPLKWSLAQSRELQIGNLIIEYFWQTGIYLDRTHSQGDVYTVKLFFQIDRNSRAIVAKELNEHSEALQTYCRVLKPVAFNWDADIALMSATVALKQKPVEPPSDKDIYRILEPAENFGAIIRKYHNHKEGGKPTLRVMGGTGGGKSLATKVIIKSYVDSEDGWEIRLSDPMDGSEEDYWDIAKVATDDRTAKKAFAEFVREFDARSVKASLFPQQKLLGIFDEFDKQHDEDDKENAKRVWTAIRHHSMRLVLMGQSSQVGANGWQWDDMRNCTLLFVGDAVITATNKYKELGWDLKTKNRIDREYRQISEWMTAKNTDEELPPESQYRLALLVCGSVIKFLEIPKAVIGTIDNGRSWIVSKPWEFSNADWVEIESLVEVMTAVKCPHCGSSSWKKNGKDKATRTVQQYKCNDCNKGFSHLDVFPNSN
ncbi:transposase-like zinc-binding domain-containing protein [Scytonema sp. PCC 10023]|uniref:IS1/IS1595 family N-terminal zinc-binding domain-containing protein n=1 Tax=Scytonema sp. PCC 10023 TaxID=1680591 RepID=UPI0039C72B43